MDNLNHTRSFGMRHDSLDEIVSVVSSQLVAEGCCGACELFLGSYILIPENHTCLHFENLPLAGQCWC